MSATDRPVDAPAAAPEPYDGTPTTWYVDSPEVSASSSEGSSSSASSSSSSSSAPTLAVARPVDEGAKFEAMGLDKQILDGLFAASFASPSYIQASAIPKILGSPETHLLVEAQSGSGKTLAFVVPALQRINLAKKTPQVVFILPTRELATQVCKVTQLVGKYLEGLTVQLAVKEDKDTPKIPTPVTAHILVGTPGKVSQVLTTKKYCADPKQVILLAIDEADQMIPPAPTEAHMMFQQLSKARAAVHPKCQLLFMSATFPENVEHFRTALFNKGAYDSIRVAPDKRVVSTIQQLFIRCSNNKEKLGALYKIYTELQITQSFIFVRTRETAQHLKRLMTNEGFQVSLISSELSPADRDLVFKKFQAGEAKVLIATNVMARGIDVRNVSLIINFDLPTCDKDGKVADVDNYFHRVGRTGRFGDYGLAINLVENDQDLEFIKLFETSQHKEIEPCQVSEIPSLQAKLDLFQNKST